MRVRNNQNFNVSVYAKHTGNGTPEYITVPAGATLELDDAEWTEKFAKAAEPQIENGNLEVTKAVALTAEEEEARNKEQLEAAEKLIADNKAAEKAKADAAKAKLAAK